MTVKNNSEVLYEAFQFTEMTKHFVYSWANKFSAFKGRTSNGVSSMYHIRTDKTVNIGDYIIKMPTFKKGKYYATILTPSEFKQQGWSIHSQL